MWTETHLSLWWSILCSSWFLSHLHFVLARSSGGTLELVWVMDVGRSWSWTPSLHRSDGSSARLVRLLAAAWFQTQKRIFFALHVTYSLNAAAVVRLAAEVPFFFFSVRADTSETIETRCRSPPFTVTTQQRPKTPKHSGNPGRSGPHSTLFQGLITGICCVPRDRTQRWTREQNKVTERWRQRFKFRLLSLPELKDGFLEQCLHGCIAWLKLLPSIKHMGLIYPCGSQWWCRKHQAPSGRNKRARRKGETLVVEKHQFHKGLSRWHIAGSLFVLWRATSK